MSTSVDHQVLFALLRHALGLSDQLPDCSGVQWPQLFRFAQQQSVAPLLVPTIAQLPESQRPPRSVWIPWLAEQDRARQRYHTAVAAVSTLTARFSSHAIPTLLFKGLTLSDCYPDPSLRPFSDIDLYHYGHHAEADQLLRNQLGITIVNRAQPHTQYMYQGLMFENHYAFLNLTAIPSNRPYEQLLRSLLASPPPPLADSSLTPHPSPLTPSPTFSALYLMRHMAGHFAASTISLRHLCDWRMFLNRYSDQIDWPLVNATFADHRMTSFATAITDLSSFTPHPSSLPKESFPIASPPPRLPASPQRILSSILSPPSHPSESLSRLFWKIRRYHANRWKRRITCRDSEPSLLLHALTSHLRHPYTLRHRV